LARAESSSEFAREARAADPFEKSRVVAQESQRASLSRSVHSGRWSAEVPGSSAARGFSAAPMNA
jgi:hypothetical protein